MPQTEEIAKSLKFLYLDGMFLFLLRFLKHPVIKHGRVNTNFERLPFIY